MSKPLRGPENEGEEPTGAGCVLALLSVLLACGATTLGGVVLVPWLTSHAGPEHGPVLASMVGGAAPAAAATDGIGGPLLILAGAGYVLAAGVYYYGSELLNAIGVATSRTPPDQEPGETPVSQPDTES